MAKNRLDLEVAKFRQAETGEIKVAVTDPAALTLLNEIKNAILLSGDGVGIPEGGQTGQVLTKVSEDDFDVNWQDVPVPQLADVATSGDYNDLINLPVIPDVSNFETTTELNNRDTANRDRANHTGTQDISTVNNLQTELDNKQAALTGFNNALFYQEAPSVISAIPNWEKNAIGGLGQTPTINGGNLGFVSFNNVTVNTKHDQNSPNRVVNLFSNQVNVDVDDDGFAWGSGGSAIQFYNSRVIHNTEADIGRIEFNTQFIGMGENGGGTVDLNGVIVNAFFSDFKDNVRLIGGMQGYIFQPTFETGAEINSFWTSFADFTNAPGVDFEFYTGLQISPNIGGIKENTNFNGVNINPQITTFTENASATAVGIFGNYGSFGANGFFQGVAISPNITTVPNATLLNIAPNIDGGTNITGIDVNMSNVTATNVTAARFTGDVQINGGLQFSGALSIGQLNAFDTAFADDFGFQPGGVHALVSNLVGLENETHANADMIGVNTASIMVIQEDCTLTSGVFGLGFAACALPAVILTEPGSSIEHIHAAVYALNFDQGSTGGTVQNAHGARVVFIPNGVTTVNNSRGYVYDAPFGPVSANAWGMYINADVENWFKQSVKIGGSDTVENNSVGLQVDGRAILMPRLTTTERNALTALNGMVIYNVTDNKFQGYENGSWVNL